MSPDYFVNESPTSFSFVEQVQVASPYPHSNPGLDRSKQDYFKQDDSKLSDLKESQLTRDLAYLDTIIQNEDFALFEQRQWDLDQRRIIGTEVLLRIPTPSNKDIFLDTNYWVSLAESKGRLKDLTHKVLEKLIRNGNTLFQQNVSSHQIIPCYVNVPPPLVSFEFVDYLKNLLDHNRLPYHFIGIELTEREPINDFIQFRRGFDALNQLKIPVALDDFGQGYSTMNFLRDIRVDRVKIDGSLLHEARSDLSKRMTLLSLLNFAMQHKIEVIAEGIENDDDYLFVRQLGCTGLQGFHIEAPRILVSVDK